MTERIDMAGRAWDIWHDAVGRGHPEAGDNPAHESMLSMLNALVEQQRIANEIALRQAKFELHPQGTVQAVNDEQTVERFWAALGLTAGQEGEER